MSIGVPPLNSALSVEDNMARFDQPWANWFSALFLCIFGWRKSYTTTLSKTWGLIAAHAEDSQTVTVTGAQAGDLVLVQPATKTAGIVDNLGVVTAANTVTVYAQNTTGAGVTPGAKTYRLVVLQQ